ncbi:MAG: UDP-3-O-(3-hydroxymyristoyl)glucosamine N-acyltransferase [Phycisphaerae bacterium]|nr:UDP-3-O-(3-hydroxymyristoyl)glucosamine N-acyltransferase [Phycisphaerae bacterium]
MDVRRLGDELPRLVERMVGSYRADPRTHHIDKDYLPSREAITSLVDLLVELTYPGFFGRQGLTQHNISYHVGELLPKLWDQLVVQVEQCLCYERERCGSSEPARSCREKAILLSNDFLHKLAAIRDLLATDVQAAFDGDPAARSCEETILSYPGVLAITIHRYAHALHVMGVPMMPRIMSEHAHHLTGIDIHPGARIGRSFFIDHGSGVVIGETAEVGDNVKIYQGVTLGALSFPKDERGRVLRGRKRHPTVGNNVTIYANAIILGGDTTIGDGAIIGGSVFLTRSVQPGHRVTLTAPALEIRGPNEVSPFFGDYVI